MDQAADNELRVSTASSERSTDETETHRRQIPDGYRAGFTADDQSSTILKQLH